MAKSYETFLDEAQELVEATRVKHVGEITSDVHKHVKKIMGPRDMGGILQGTEHHVEHHPDGSSTVHIKHTKEPEAAKQRFGQAPRMDGYDRTVGFTDHLRKESGNWHNHEPEKVLNHKTDRYDKDAYRRYKGAPDTAIHSETQHLGKNTRGHEIYRTKVHIKPSEGIQEEAKVIYPVINARSPADQEFTDAHAAVVSPDPAGNGDSLFKGSTHKDVSRRADKWTGDDDADDAAAEKGLDKAGTFHDKLDEEFDALNLDQLEESVKGPYHAAYEDAKKVLHPQHHKAAAKMFARMNRGGDEHEELHRANLHHFQELRPVLKKHKIAEETTDFHEAAEELAEYTLNLQELSKKTLASYISKSSSDATRRAFTSGVQRTHSSHKIMSDTKASDEHYAKARKADDQMFKRRRGIDTAVRKLSEAELLELSKKTLGSYVLKSTQSYADHSHKREKSRDDADRVSRTAHNASPEVKKAVDTTVDALHKSANDHDYKRLKRGRGITKAVKRLSEEALEQMSADDFMDVCENFDQLDEISKNTLVSYVGKASKNAADHSRAAGGYDEDAQKHVGKNPKAYIDAVKGGVYHDKKANKRLDGIQKAAKKLSEEELLELSKKTLGSYIKKAESDFWKRGGDQYRGTNKTNIRKIRNRDSGLTRAEKKLSEEQLDEISKDTLKSYVRKASNEITDHGLKAQEAEHHGDQKTADKHYSHANKRDAGIAKAEVKIHKKTMVGEESDLQELSNKVIKSYQDRTRKELFKKGQDWDTFKKRSAGMSAATRAKIRNDKKTQVN